MGEHMILNPDINLWEGGARNLFETFHGLALSTKREGINQVLEWLTKDTDFFSAPASSNGHDNIKYGLVFHALTVYFNMKEMADCFDLKYPSDSLIISGIFHDVCKSNFYSASTRSKKNELTGKWFQEPYFSIDDRLPLGHGEKSVILLQKFMQLTNPEIMAIRWHMAGFEIGSYSAQQSLSKAMQEYPLITLLHCADLFACLPEPMEEPCP
jgi:HD superfamily phosphohydrolase YqeK